MLCVPVNDLLMYSSRLYKFHYAWNSVTSLKYTAKTFPSIDHNVTGCLWSSLYLDCKYDTLHFHYETLSNNSQQHTSIAWQSEFIYASYSTDRQTDNKHFLTILESIKKKTKFIGKNDKIYFYPPHCSFK